MRWKDKEKVDAFYQNFTPLTPHDIAASVVFCASQPPHVNIVEIMILPTEQNAPNMLTKIGSVLDKGIFSSGK